MQRIVGDVPDLSRIVLHICNPVGEVTRLPHFACIVLPHGKRKAAFDELGGLLDGLSRREQDVQMVWHDDKAVQQEPSSAPGNGAWCRSEVQYSTRVGRCGGVQKQRL